MKNKITICSLLLAGMFFTATAQNKKSIVPALNSSCDAAPALLNHKINPTPALPQSLFNIQFNYNATDSTAGSTGMAGVVFTGTEFWVSQWNSDSIFSYTPTGTLISKFKVPTVTGIRGMTWDGNFIYAGVNTTSIKKINPTTKTLAGTITVAAGISVRHITYDSTANAGAGGFWVGNFSTNIVQISMTGATLNTITAATHGLTAMYGSAIDHWTSGGPYLWVFDQGGTSQSRIVRLQLPSGVQTGVIHDVMTDVGVSQTSGLAGGLFITNKLNSSARTIVGVLQGTPDDLLFGYELNDFVLPSLDASLDTLRPVSPFVMVPITHYTSPMNWKGNISNQGASTITSGNLVVDVKQSGTPVYNGSVPFSNLATGATFIGTTTTGPSASIKATFDVTAYAQTNAPQVDLVGANDTLRYSYMVTDSVMARETGQNTGALGIGGGTGGTLGQLFTTTVNDKISSVTFHLNSPTLGDSVSVDIYDFLSGQPNSIIAGTNKYYFTAADTAGVTLTLPLAGGHYFIAPGTYFVGVNEFGNNVSLATTSFNFTPASAWVIFGANAWAPIEDYGFFKTFSLRLNLEGTAYTGISEANVSGSFNVYPNPASSNITVELAKKATNAVTVKLFNAMGGLVYSGNMNPSQAERFTLDVSSYPAGMYYLQLNSGKSGEIRKVAITK